MKSQLESWLNVPAIMETKKFGNVEGMIKYGIRIPIAPGTTPLKECKPDSLEEFNGEPARYWFVNPKQTIKVKLKIQEQEEDHLKGLAWDTEYFSYTIRRK